MTASSNRIFHASSLNLDDPNSAFPMIAHEANSVPSKRPTRTKGPNYCGNLMKREASPDHYIIKTTSFKESKSLPEISDPPKQKGFRAALKRMKDKLFPKKKTVSAEVSPVNSEDELDQIMLRDIKLSEGGLDTPLNMILRDLIEFEDKKSLKDLARMTTKQPKSVLFGNKEFPADLKPIKMSPEKTSMPLESQTFRSRKPIKVMERIQEASDESLPTSTDYEPDHNHNIPHIDDQKKKRNFSRFAYKSGKGQKRHEKEEKENSSSGNQNEDLHEGKIHDGNLRPLVRFHHE